MSGVVTDEIGAINNLIAEKIGQQKYQIWFHNTTRLDIAEDYLRITVPNLFIANWLQGHFAGQINIASKEATGKDLKLTFAIDPKLTGHQRCSEPSAAQTAVVNSQGPAVPRKHLAQTADKKVKLTLDSFVVGQSNELAYNAAKTVIRDTESHYNPLFIHGGYGVGKTHLMQGICNEISSCRPNTDWLYLSAEDFANQYILALKTKKLEAFRRRLRETDLLAIDDIHFLASKPSMQEEFLHTFNSIDMAGKQIILASDAHPKQINQISEKLISRFVSGMVVKIEQPDFDTRCEICSRFIERIGATVSDGVIKFIAESLKSSVRELEGAILKLTAFCQLQNIKPTIAVAREVLIEHLARTDPIVHITDIESATASYFSVTTNCLHSAKKDKTISLARHMSMYLARKHTKMSSTEIGRYLGNKNHATVLTACKKVEQRLEQNAVVNWHGTDGNRVAKIRKILTDLEEAIAGN